VVSLYECAQHQCTSVLANRSMVSVSASYSPVVSPFNIRWVPVQEINGISVTSSGINPSSNYLSMYSLGMVSASVLISKVTLSRINLSVVTAESISTNSSVSVITALQIMY
jgi:hypothetical protein